MLPTLYNNPIALGFAFSQLAMASANAVGYTGNGSLDDDTYESEDSTTTQTTVAITSTAEETTEETTASENIEASTTTEIGEETVTAASTESTATEQWTAESLTSTESTTDLWATESLTSTELTTEQWTATSLTSTLTDSATATTTASTTASDATGTCGTAYAQCGGLDYTGATCCQNGYQCITANSYWARCVVQSTLGSSSVYTKGSGASSVKLSTELETSTSTEYSTYITTYATNVYVSGSSYSTIITSKVVSSGIVVKVESSVNTISSTNGASGMSLRQYTNDKSGWKAKALIAGLIGFSMAVATA
ncbi:hypothetical protein CANARDRAFT_30019 [[Candida] arabinofermentans NRRL YB-2248]|uniref:CBM1 domain-containing protein n=1 Tax=[Candida] arabinofermentans NRRL YB-2248 TaxID=983967 RepID=A0A1E4SV64_9ASCO|nr:hypothetical protein CANARDRAFT_30019 [[Candida] arabinofermentans NRRL YB-2248]